MINIGPSKVLTCVTGTVLKYWTEVVEESVNKHFINLNDVQ